MKFITKIGLLFTVSLSGALISATASAQQLLWEIPDSQLPDIVLARAHPRWGSSVIYNPKTCEEIGDACAFFRKHAYAHSALNHLLLPPKSYPAPTEAKADCWAAKYVKPEEALAAYNLFKEGASGSNWQLYGDLDKRAETVRECAMKAGNWIETAENSVKKQNY